MRACLIVLALVLAATPALSEEIACEGAFAADSSEARLIEIYGAENVWHGTVPGPEGTEMLATRVYPDEPKRMLEFTWWDEERRENLADVHLPSKLTAPGGVRIGMTVDEVEAINGEPFKLNGFGWDYGGYAGFRSGALSDLPGGCGLSVRFYPSDDPVDQNVDAVYGDVELQSDDPLIDVVGARVGEISIGYPHPDYQ
jgi:hypothetical protein